MLHHEWRARLNRIGRVGGKFREIFTVQRSTADESPIDVWLGNQFGDRIWLTGTAVEDPELRCCVFTSQFRDKLT